MDHSLKESVIKSIFYKKILLQHFLLTNNPLIFLRFTANLFGSLVKFKNTSMCNITACFLLISRNKSNYLLINHLF